MLSKLLFVCDKWKVADEYRAVKILLILSVLGILEVNIYPQMLSLHLLLVNILLSYLGLVSVAEKYIGVFIILLL